MSTLRNVPMRFLEEGAVLLRSGCTPLLYVASEPRPQTGNSLCGFMCLESWRETWLLMSEVIHGCDHNGWEILKRAEMTC